MSLRRKFCAWIHQLALSQIAASCRGCFPEELMLLIGRDWSVEQGLFRVVYITGLELMVSATIEVICEAPSFISGHFFLFL